MHTKKHMIGPLRHTTSIEVREWLNTLFHQHQSLLFKQALNENRRTIANSVQVIEIPRYSAAEKNRFVLPQ